MRHRVSRSAPIVAANRSESKSSRRVLAARIRESDGCTCLPPNALLRETAPTRENTRPRAASHSVLSIPQTRGPGSSVCTRSCLLLRVAADPNAYREPPSLNQITDRRWPALVNVRADDAAAKTPETTRRVRLPNEAD